MLTLAAARRILDATLAAAREHKLKPLSVAVIDARGALIAFASEDGTSLKRESIARGRRTAPSPSACRRGRSPRWRWSARISSRPSRMRWAGRSCRRRAAC